MGVYIFRSRHADWIKVGHHLVTPRRPNAYYRVAGRGFQTVVHPDELDGKLWLEDLELVAWYPNLTTHDELDAHHLTPKELRVGEFHPAESVDVILQLCDARDARVTITDAQKRQAIAWGRRQCRRATRRRKAA